MVFRRDMMEVALFPWRSLFIICPGAVWVSLCCRRPRTWSVALLSMMRHELCTRSQTHQLHFELDGKLVLFAILWSDYPPLSYRTETSHGSTTYLTSPGKRQPLHFNKFSSVPRAYIFSITNITKIEDWTSCVALRSTLYLFADAMHSLSLTSCRWP